MRTKEIVFSILVVMFFFFGCSKDESNTPTGSNTLPSGPEIEWVSGGTTITYSYSGGVISGYGFHRSFIVLNESGEISINVQILNDDNTKVSHTFNVEKGIQYALKVNGSINGRQISSPGAGCLTVVFSSPNCPTTKEIRVGSYLVSIGGFDNYYCPKSLSFGTISITN